MGRLRACACVVALAPAIALAQPKGDVQKAGELVKQAITKSQAGDHDGAIALYQKAYAVVPQPMLLSNIGSEYQHANKPDDAVKFFCRYLAADPTGVNSQYSTAQVKTLQIQLGHQVDDKDACKVIPPKPATKPLPPPEMVPPTSPEPTPEVTATADHPTEAPADTGGGNKKTLEYAGFGITGAGAVLFAIGTYYGVEAKRISDSISSHDMNLPWDPHIRDIEREGQSDENKQIGFMIVGGVVMVGGAVVALIGHNRAAEHVAIAPTATPSSVGLVVSGGF
jgi:hypothetical protein